MSLLVAVSAKLVVGCRKDDATVKAAEKAAAKVIQNPKVERKVQLKVSSTNCMLQLHIAV